MILNWELFLENMVGTIPISDVQSYIDGMGMSYVDKLFFLNKVNPDVIVDFGCANGFILSKIKEKFPDIKLIGYDVDVKMLENAKKLLGDDVILTSNWDLVCSEISNYKSPTLVLSSVIHEVYSYTNSKVVKKFWEKQVFGNNFQYICIRDMIPSVAMNKHELVKFEKDVERVKDVTDPFYLKSFEKRWGEIDGHYRTFIHFLLKYKYIDNWDREVNENYLPVSLETLKKKIPSGYKILFEETFILPHLKNQVQQDFGINIDHTTHTKMIIKNNKYK